MTLKNDEKSEEELTCGFKIDIRNLTNFDSSRGIWQILTEALESQKFTL